VTNANGPPVLHVGCYFASTSHFLLSLYTPDQQAQNKPPASAALQTTVQTTASVQQDMSPFQISATQLSSNCQSAIDTKPKAAHLFWHSHFPTHIYVLTTLHISNSSETE